MRNPLYYTEKRPTAGACYPLEDLHDALGNPPRTYACPEGGARCVESVLRVLGVAVDAGIDVCAKGVNLADLPQKTIPS